MKYKIEELKDITDSREIMNSTPKGFSKYMMYIIIGLLTVTIIWSLIAKKQIVVSASGVLKPSEEVYKITSSISGNVTSVNLQEGMEVKKGDILISVNGDEYSLQQNVLQDNLNKKEKELESAKKLKDSINDGINYLSKDDDIENTYYKKYELYITTLNEYEKQGTSSETQLSNTKRKINDLNMLLRSMDEKVNYFSEDHYLYYQYVDYEMTLNQYRKQIDTYNEKIKELENKKVTNIENNEEKTDNEIEGSEVQVSDNKVSNEAIDEEINILKESILSNENELEKYINSQKSSIRSSIAQHEESLKGGIVSDNSSTYKSQYLSELAVSISSLEDAVSEIKINLDLANSKLEATSIKAEYDGVINVLNEVKAGDYIQSGTAIANIVPNENSKFIAEVYIENQDFGEILEGEDVTLEFLALPQNEYGIIKTKLNNISVDAKINEGQGVSFYTAICDVNKTSLENRSGKSINLKSGMLVHARIINREVTYFRYFMELINILK